MRRWKVRPLESNWGDFGEDDEIGRLNLITPELRLAAAREVREGIAFCLSLPLNLPISGLQPSMRSPPQISSLLGGNDVSVGELFGVRDVSDIANDDRVILCTQQSTQWDGLRHIGSLFDSHGNGKSTPVYYNGYSIGGSKEHAQNASSYLPLGIDKMAETGVQGRGVLINLFHIYGREKALIGYRELREAIHIQRITVRPGDVLCIYTGFADLVLSQCNDPCVQELNSSFSELDGRDHKLLSWITESGIVAICADNLGVEPHPNSPLFHRRGSTSQAGPNQLFPLHHHCLFKLGIHLGELWYFEKLATWLLNNNRNSFLLTAPPLRLPGAVGSPVTPIATV